jgi:hypothetical protein
MISRYADCFSPHEFCMRLHGCPPAGSRNRRHGSVECNIDEAGFAPFGNVWMTPMIFADEKEMDFDLEIPTAARSH